MGSDVAEISVYKPRAAWFDGLATCGPATIKLNIIEADPANPVAEAAVGLARRQIETAAEKLAALPHLGVGFAILHQGEEGLAGCSCTGGLRAASRRKSSGSRNSATRWNSCPHSRF